MPAKQAERFAQNSGSSKQHEPGGRRGNLSGACGASSPKRRALRLRCDLAFIIKLGTGIKDFHKKCVMDLQLTAAQAARKEV